MLKSVTELNVLDQSKLVPKINTKFEDFSLFLKARVRSLKMYLTNPEFSIQNKTLRHLLVGMLLLAATG